MRRLFRWRARENEESPVAFEENISGEPSEVMYDALSDDTPIEPFVPVSRTYDEYGTVESGDLPRRRSRRSRLSRPRVRLPRLRLPRLSVSRPSLGLEIRSSVLLLVLLLAAAGVFGTFLKQDRIGNDIEVWWPSVIVIGAVVWMLAALVRRQVAAFLGAAAVVGVGISLLLDAQDIAAAQETLLGIVLATIGLGIVIRGFLLRQQV
ncbi:MAG: hypothetical protein JXQ72_12600 [Anaerolineae bacterium]|nr:hypothetical protein [Anaerolineae bacterium]